jgi:hypothetical protein
MGLLALGVFLHLRHITPVFSRPPVPPPPVLTLGQQSYLCGKRYNLEKKQDERTDLTSGNSCQESTTRERLAEVYHVAPRTITKDATFAAAVDTLAERVRPDIHNAVMQPHAPDTGRTTKSQVTHAGKLNPKLAHTTPPFGQGIHLDEVSPKKVLRMPLPLVPVLLEVRLG